MNIILAKKFTMEKKNDQYRFVVCLTSWDEFETVDAAKSELNIQVEEIQYRAFDAVEPSHVFINNEDLAESFVWIYFYSESDLEELDINLLEYSQDFNGNIKVIDFDNQLYQAYDSGEHDTGMFSMPEDAEVYKKSIIEHHNNENSEYSLMKFPIILE